MSALGPINVLAADWIDTHGWTQRVEQTPDGRVCLTGALRACSPQPGDWLIAREVYRRRDRAEEWNDAEGRTAPEVTGYLRSAQITDADLADTFGPQWEQIVALVRRAAVLTEDEARDLAGAWFAAESADWSATRSAAGSATRFAPWFAAWFAAESAARTAAGDAVRDAVGALVVRDLIGTHGLTQEHYDLMTRPWASVIGKVHPDD